MDSYWKHRRRAAKVKATRGLAVGGVGQRRFRVAQEAFARAGRVGGHPGGVQESFLENTIFDF